MSRIAVITFDEPEFAPSYVGTVNEGRAIFAWLFFTGRCRFSHIDLAIFRRRNPITSLIFILMGLYFATKSIFFKTETVFDNLLKENIPATFYGVFELIEGPERETYLPIFREILSRGHELGLHGYRHGPLTDDELKRSLKLAKQQLGVELETYSSPFGDDRVETLELLERHGFLGMRVWDRKFLNLTSPVRRHAYDYSQAKVLASDEDVIIINLHSGDYYPRGFSRVKETIRRLKARGYKFLTFRDLCRTT